MQTRSTILGKRGHQDSSSISPANSFCEQLQTPDNTPSPKRARTTTVVVDGDSNKENIPPFNDSPINIDISPRAVRALRRNATESVFTPTRSRALRRHTSASSLEPATPTSNLVELTLTPPPSPPVSLLPIHARVRALLRSTCNNTSSQIAGRDTERTSLLKFLTSFIDGTPTDHDPDPTSMFISGAPGTGKTALVNAVIRDLSAKNDHVQVVFINCMALKSVDALWERIIEDLVTAPKKKSTANRKTNAYDRLKTLLSTLNTQCILILDELDHVTPNSQCLASIFSLSRAIPSVLRLIGIANTHTLTASSTSGTFAPSTDIQTIHFAPYTPIQLQGILQSRLSPLHGTECPPEVAVEVKKFLPPPTLMLLTKKVAALTGDVRSLFEVLRGAIDLAVVPSTTQQPVDENPFNFPKATVTPQHILAALKAYTPAASKIPTTNSNANTSPTTSNSETVTKIRNLGLQAQLVLLTILLASKRLDVGLSLSTSSTASPKKPTASASKRAASSFNPCTPGTAIGMETGLLYTYYSTVLSRADLGIFEPVSRSEFADLMGVLEGVGLVSLSSSLLASVSGPSPGKGKKAFGRSTSFGAGLGKNGAGAVGELRLVEGVWADEILRGLGATGTDVLPASDDMPVDARKEEIRSIWEREKSRLTKDLKSLASAASAASRPETFAEAFQD
ncbi:P-loop containing nucleoside triphosphate hydrolase protein [Phlegmacium glaucopus]|nr:P-loop containing nucleoside triphosphate hydrolase protein [Phlegmacium glaucopus]